MEPQWISFLNPFLLAFLATTPTLVALKTTGELNRSWVGLAAWIILSGWILINVSIWWEFKVLEWRIASVEDPPEEWYALLSNDAKRAGALFLGWVYPVVYSLVAGPMTLGTIWIGNAFVGRTRRDQDRHS